MCASPVRPDRELSRLPTSASITPHQLAGSSTCCPQATLRCQCRNPRQLGAIDHLIEIERKPTAPVGMLVRRTGKIRLLDFADNIFQLNQRQAGARACEIAQDRVAEL